MVGVYTSMSIGIPLLCHVCAFELWKTDTVVLYSVVYVIVLSCILYSVIYDCIVLYIVLCRI